VDPTANILSVLTPNSNVYNVTAYYTSCQGTSPFNSSLTLAASSTQKLNSSVTTAINQLSKLHSLSSILVTI
jgi:hypothetical protein